MKTKNKPRQIVIEKERGWNARVGGRKRNGKNCVVILAKYYKLKSLHCTKTHTLVDMMKHIVCDTSQKITRHYTARRAVKQEKTLLFHTLTIRNVKRNNVL